MNSSNITAFSNLYPDVDPSKGLPLTRAERLSITLAAAVLSYGFLSGNIIVAGTGLLLLLFATIYPSQKTARRIRKEAKERFPAEDWSEYHSLRAVNLSLLIPFFWIMIIAINIAVFWYLVDLVGMPAIGGATALTAVLIWLMPGMNPLWSVQRRRKKQRTEAPQQQHEPFPAAPPPQPSTSTSRANQSVLGSASDDTSRFPAQP